MTQNNHEMSSINEAHVGTMDASFRLRKKKKLKKKVTLMGIKLQDKTARYKVTEKELGPRTITIMITKSNNALLIISSYTMVCVNA